jgi:aminopeptidase-like protein
MDDQDRIEYRFDELWPFTRSITGPGFRESLDILQKDIPLEIESVSSGTDVFDWEVPPEWRISEARLTGPDGSVYADLEETNLAVVNYSTSINQKLSLEELDNHLYTLPEHPGAIPYVTSYYERNWGFCLPHDVYESLPNGEYHAYIDTELDEAGELNYGHTVLEGESDREILLSTYLCHPSLANNELSGPLVMSSLFRRISQWNSRKFTYRFVVVPETIGSLTYLSRYGDHLQEQLVAGLVLTCLGGPEPTLSFKETRRGDTLLDDLVHHLTDQKDSNFRIRRFDTGGSDERQYCSPGFNLPVGQFARTVYGEYNGYHNSMDTKEFMGIDPLVNASETIERFLRTLEYAGYYMNQQPYGEPMMSKRDLYPTVNSPDSGSRGDLTTKMMRILNFSDGTNSLVDIAERYNVSIDELEPATDALMNSDLLEPFSYVPTDPTHINSSERTQ